MTPDRAHNLPDCHDIATRRELCELHDLHEFADGRCVDCGRSTAEADLKEHAAMLAECEWDTAILQEEA